MSVSIEDVLSLLPEMFPGVQPIPLKNLRPNPKNPGPPITEEQIQEMSENLAASGLENPIKVQPDRENLLAGGAQLHPDNPRLRGDGKPWEVKNFNYMVLTGNLRYFGADRLKWQTIPGFIKNPTKKQKAKSIRLDNAIRERGWWADYQSIEELIQADPDMTQEQVAVELKMDRIMVGRAMRVLPLLGQKTKDLLCSNATLDNKGILDLSERAIARLGSASV
jgi:ParB-like chromosome segregation protein Spo0J